jgi:hypothetical protein
MKAELGYHVSRYSLAVMVLVDHQMDVSKVNLHLREVRAKVL